jgi:hypothetical protein
MSNDIKLTAQDQTIGYKGNVTLKLIRNGKVYKEVSEHNSGTVAFFRLMALSIAGDTSAVSEMPNYICLFNATSSTDTSPKAVLISANLPSISRTPTNNGSSGYKVIFSFLIPYTLISSGAIINRLRLYGSTNRDNYLAELHLSTPLSVSSGSNLLIDWEMVINNA